MTKRGKASTIGGWGLMALGLGACSDSQRLPSVHEAPAMPRVGGVVYDTSASPPGTDAGVYRSGWVLVIRDAQWPSFWAVLRAQAQAPLERARLDLPLDRQTRDRYVSRTVAIRANGRFDVTLAPGKYAFCAADLGDALSRREPQVLGGCSEVLRVADGEAPLVFSANESGFVAKRRP
ncbi:MAG: hypothetical protein AAFX85_01290 [Pseudomonadota bacterium]